MKQLENTDARHFSRIQFSIPISLSSANMQQTWECKLIDISLHGVLISRPEDWTGAVGETFQIDLCLAKGSTITMEVSTAHIEQTSLGFTCIHIDIESITHLKRLIELNLGNKDILERELSELMHVND
ncbi:hypothetical protein MNBD_GAMMA22-2201 [hydrothermal vent metagenome]|uniref:PilZ domain-containing protein n=1 Tax=hydrothermal vent metagenome TaxID=652676 RepID=A0A3B1A7T8_9ZZZZ